MKITIRYLSLLVIVCCYSLSGFAVQPAINNAQVSNYNLLSGGIGISYQLVNASGNPTTTRINYGITSSYGSFTTNTSFTGPGSTNLTNEITGLSLNTVYHYSITATDISGTTNSPDATFTNNAVGVVTYLALINYVRTALGTNFNTNSFPYSLTNLVNLLITNCAITGSSFTNPVSLNGDTLVGNGFSAIVSSYINTNYLVTSTILTNSLCNIPSSILNGLYRISVYGLVTTTGTGNITNSIVYSDELGLITNTIYTNNLANLGGAPWQGVAFIHAKTNISLILSPSSLSGSPAVDFWATVERIQ